jgi:hypothetical protein
MAAAFLGACGDDVGSRDGGISGSDASGSAAGCDLDVATLRNRAESSDEGDGVELVTGFVQASANNQNPFVARLDGDTVVWCRRFSSAPPDERGVLAHVESQDRVWVAFTTDGGNTDLTATAGAFQSSYGRGGGPKVSWVARLDAVTGNVEAATFLHSTLSSGDSNTLVVRELRVDGSTLVVRADAWFTPPLEPPGSCDGDSPFDWTGRFDLELTELMSGTAPGCGP